MYKRLKYHVRNRKRSYFGFNIFYVVLLLMCLYVPFHTTISKFVHINDIENIVQSALNLLMFAVTAYMAWVTYKMFLTMKEARVAEVKPILLFDLAEPKIIQHLGFGDDDREFSTEITICNFSRSPAIGIQVRASIPRDTENFISTNNTVSPVLYPSYGGNEYRVKHKVQIPIKRYDVALYGRDFLELEVLYEDIERNLYRMHFFYGIIDYGGKYGWRRSLEELHLTNYKNRSYFEDLGSSTSEDKEELIFSRKTFFYND